MSISSLDPVSALVVIDLQQGIVSRPVVHPIQPVVRNAARLAEAFRKRGLPVVLVNVAGGAPGRTQSAQAMGSLPPNWAELVPELNAQPTDVRVTKLTWGAFTGTALDLHLRRARATQVVLCGVATSIGVESTARAAHELGYNVALVTDAMTDLSPEAHTNSVERIFPRLGETGTTAEVLSRLTGDAP